MHAILEQYLLPTFGHYRLANITPYLIVKWMFGLLDRGLSHKRVNNILSYLRIMIGEAHRLGLVQKNPFNVVRPLADNTRNRGVYTLDEVRKLFAPENIESVWGGHLLYRAINTLAADTGMRHGESLRIALKLITLTPIIFLPKYAELCLVKTYSHIPHNFPLLVGLFGVDPLPATHHPPL